MHPSTRRALVLSVVLVLTVLTAQSLISPLVLGWHRADELIELEDHRVSLAEEAQALVADIEYRKTDGGKKLAALETMGATDPGGHELEVTPAEAPKIALEDQAFAERMKAWRGKSRISLYQDWRVMSLYLFDQRHPAELPDKDDA